jgi:predicted TPR repeat methyltransferase
MNEGFARARQLFLDGVDHYEAGRYAEAEAALLGSLAVLPGRPSTLMNLGATRLALGRAGEALPDLQASLAAEPDNVQSWCHLGAALIALGHHAQALQAWDRALSLEPALPAARFHRAMTLGLMQQHAQALETLQPLLQSRDPASAPAWLLAGQALQNLGRHADALEPYQNAVGLAPALPRAAVLLGQLLHSLGRSEEAMATHAAALTRGVDVELHRYLLAALRGEDAPPASPAGYVRALFDPYAEDFEHHLLDALHYRGHQAVVDAAIRAAQGRIWESVLDLGCGTGLCGRLIRSQARQLTGVDLSPTMVESARRSGAYDRLLQTDVALHLAHSDARHDLLLAADVFIYIGALGPVMAGATRVLQPGGLFCFTVETLSDGEVVSGDGFVLRRSLRYAHDTGALASLAAQHGLQWVDAQPVVLREEQRQPIAGAVITLRA